MNREVIWIILRKLGCTDHFDRLVSTLNTKMKVSVSLRGELSEPFEVRNRVKQGCLFAPTLFLIFVSMVLSDTVNDSTQEV